MSPRYLLPCSCGRAVPVSIGQAGGQAICECGQTLDVPMLRDLRTLKTAGEQLANQTANSTGPQVTVARAVFAVSVLVAVISLAIGALLTLQRSAINPGPSRSEQTKLEESSIDEMPIDLSYQLWTDFKTGGLNSMSGTPWQQAKLAHEQLGRFMTIAFSIGGVAIVLVLISALLAGKR